MSDTLWVVSSRREARRGGQTLDLSPSAVAVLAVFADSGSRVVGRTELTRRAGLMGRSARRCDSLIVELRRALGPDAIVTVRSRGWRFVV